MEYWVLTRLGREAIPLLHEAGRDEEANILELLDRATGVTVEQVAYAMRLDNSTARHKLRSLSVNRWVWRKITKATPF